MDQSAQLAQLLKTLQSTFRRISTFLVVNISISSLFFLLSLYQEYDLDLYNLLLSFILYGSLISFSLELFSFTLGFILAKETSPFSLSSFLKLILLLVFFLLIFTISIWMKPYQGG